MKNESRPSVAIARRFLAVLVLCCVGQLASAVAAEKGDAKARGPLPNIVVIMADDLGYGDLGCYNTDSKIPTPHFDRLAQQSMRFTDAHSPSGVCTPTRYGLLTGRYAWRSRMKRGVLQGYSPALIEPGRMTVASLLKSHGYTTGCVGKWHLGLGEGPKTDYSQPLVPGPTTVGFDYFFGIPASLDMVPYVFVENDRPLEQPTESIAGSKMRRDGGEGFWRGGAIAPSFKHIDVLPKTTERAVGFIDRAAKASPRQPFFLYLPLSAPHTPWLPTESFAGKSKAGPYGDFVTQVDATLGQVLAALDRNKLTDNTLLIVTSDNGAHWLPADIAKYDHRANGQLRGQKSDIHEGGNRVPYLVRWPGRVAAGSTCDQTTCHVDILATVAAIIGADLPEGAGEDSYNILPYLLGEKTDRPIRPSLILHSGNGLFAIRSGDWKLVEGLGSGGFTRPANIKPQPGGPQGQLYNLADDPAETHNLYAQKPDVVTRLGKLLDEQRNAGRSRP